MSGDLLTTRDIYVILRKHVQEAGSHTAAAAKLGVSVGYLHDVLSARCDPGEKLLDALGYARVVRYVPKRQAPAVIIPSARSITPHA
jgi:hypothetical protein